MRISVLCAAAATVLLTALPARALESYPAELSTQFTSWCTQTQGQPQTVCSCALNKAALEIPASALASFLNASAGGGLAASAQGVGVTAVQIVTTCATSGGSTGATGGTLMKSLGGALGQ